MALIDELKERWERKLHEMADAEDRVEQLSVELYHLDIALSSLKKKLEAPAQPHGELRDAPPATSENSGDQIETSGLQTEEATVRAFGGDDQGEACEPPPGGVEESRDQLLTAFENDHIVERAPLIDAQTCEEVNPRPEPELPERWERRDAIRKLADKPEIPEGFTKWDGKSACRFHSETIVKCWMGQDDFIGPLRAGDVDWDHHSDPVLAVKVVRYSNGMAPEQPDDATDITPEADPGTQHGVEAETEGYAPVVDAEQPEPTPYDAAVQKGAITQDEANMLAEAKAELEGSTARMFAQGMMADADRHQSDQRSIVEKIGGLFKREREDA